ncbi:phospholipase D-like domain-containing protein [Leucobacter sp. Z1108]|uniref:phospholipase D-like domain-containing protein n=1 Tax=Leucobacter sp. Z1108 TaxID=3439066 RepID=UPI003F3385BF
MASETQRTLQADTAFGFLDSSLASSQIYHPQLISNQDEHMMLRAIRHEIVRAERFTFSVAFITPGALALLKQALVDFRGSGVIVTSTYLNFNAPDTFRELLGFSGVEVFVHHEVGKGFHPKGYLFEEPESSTAIIGSSNLTARALLQNKEWNLRFSALPGGDIVEQLRREISGQMQSSVPLTVSGLRHMKLTIPGAIATSWLKCHLLSTPRRIGGRRNRVVLEH